MTSTRQVVFTRLGELELVRSDVPELRPDEMLVRVRRVGICATDLHLLAGHIGDPFPLVPGHEFVGEIVGIGAAAQTGRTPAVSVGDRVAVEMLLPCRSCARCREGRYNLCEADDPARGLGRGRQYGINIPQTVAPGLWGGYADHLIVPAEAIVHLIPPAIPWHTAVLIEPLAVAFRAVSRARIVPGETVAIIGPGPVGMLAAAAASIAGASTLLMVGTRTNRLELSRRFGASHIIDSRATPDVIAEAQRLLGRRPDVVIETAGVASAQTQAARLVRRGGRVVLAGACGAETAVTFRADEDLLTREIDVLPSFLSAGGYEPAIAALARNDFPYGELVTHTFPLEDVREAFELVRTKSDDVMKAVLVLEQ